MSHRPADCGDISNEEIPLLEWVLLWDCAGLSEEKDYVKQTASGGRCQWVLDAICEIVEWPSQPLRFDSVVLRTALDKS